MPFSVTYNSPEGLIEMRVRGKLDLPTVQQLALQAAQIAKENDCRRVLSDYREAVLDLSTLQIYDLQNMLADIARTSGLRMESFKRALVVGADLADFAFFETVSQNRNQTVKLFNNIELAMQWLLTA